MTGGDEPLSLPARPARAPDLRGLIAEKPWTTYSIAEMA
jgi:hypothetical protein